MQSIYGFYYFVLHIKKTNLNFMIKETITPKLIEQLNKIRNEGKYSKVVFAGISKYVDMTQISDCVMDMDTFDCDDVTIFNEEWAWNQAGKLMRQQNKFYVISHQQYFYLHKEMPIVFNEGTLFLYDNLCKLFSSDIPIQENDIFPYNLSYHDKYHYFIDIPSNVEKLEFFSKEKKIEIKEINNADLIVDSKSDEIDLYILESIKLDNFAKKVVISSSNSPIENKKLSRLNHFLSLFGSEVIYREEINQIIDYPEFSESSVIFHKYWGKKSSFRNLNFYTNLRSSQNHTISISQKQIIDTIINEIV